MTEGSTKTNNSNKRFNNSSVSAQNNDNNNNSINMTIEGYMNMDFNQKYANIVFFEKELGGLSHKELVISKFGAVLKGGLTGRKEFFESNTPFYIDEQNKIVNLGYPNTFYQLIYPYNQVFYS